MDNLFELKLYLISLYEKNIDIDNLDENEINEYIYSLYDLDEESFSNLINDLVPLITIAKSPIFNNITYKGFANENIWLLKERIN